MNRENMNKIAALFEGWEETMIYSCLEGHMGYALADRAEQPGAALLTVADFSFFAGNPNEELVKKAEAAILVPQHKDWESLIERIWNGKVKKATRYSIKKEQGIFDKEVLQKFVGQLPKMYELRRIDQPIYEYCMSHDWSGALCAQFKNYDDYQKRGIGMAVLRMGIPVSGASSYTVYSGGIEIEIDTKEGYRRERLATACGAGLILECLKRGLYPSWDAFDLRSVALAEKLGYHRDKEYTVYLKI